MSSCIPAEAKGGFSDPAVASLTTALRPDYPHSLGVWLGEISHSGMIDVDSQPSHTVPSSCPVRTLHGLGFLVVFTLPRVSIGLPSRLGSPLT